MPQLTRVVWIPTRPGNWPCRSGSTNVFEGSAEGQGPTQPRDGNKPAGRNESERTANPVSMDPAVIAARAGGGVAELEVIGRRLPSRAD
jgi:hypothetical protein